ncbi:MAG: S-layer protein domain-containing protein [archaeon]
MKLKYLLLIFATIFFLSNVHAATVSCITENTFPQIVKINNINYPCNEARPYCNFEKASQGIGQCCASYGPYSNCIYACTETWWCSSWTACTNNQQTRTCTDSNNCGTVNTKPVISQSCTCTENWDCNCWSRCDTGDTKQTRTCTDSNNCGTSTTKPITEQNCDPNALVKMYWPDIIQGDVTGVGNTGLKIGGNYRFYVKQINKASNPKTVTLILMKSGVDLIERTVSENETFNYADMITAKHIKIYENNNYVEFSLDDICLLPSIAPIGFVPITNGANRFALAQGQYLDAGSGYYLGINSIDAKASPKQAWITLWGDGGIKKDDKVVTQDETYIYKEKSWQGKSDVPMFSTKINSIFAGATSDMVQLTETSLNAWIYFYASNPEPHIDYSLPWQACTENWQCSSWSSCTNNQQTRTCTDSNNCGTVNTKPVISQSCTVADNSSSSNSESTQQQTQSSQETQTQSQDNQEQSSFQNNQQQYPALSPDMANQNKNVERMENKSIIKIGNNSVETTLGVIEEGSKIYINTSEGKIEIKISPEIAINQSKDMENIYKITIEEYQGKVVYYIFGMRKAKLLLIFSVMAEIETKIDVESGNILEIKKPWWVFLASGV